MAPFYRWGSTASRLEPLWGRSLLFATKSPEIPGTHFIDLRRMKGWVDLGATQWFWTQDPWIRNPMQKPWIFAFFEEFVLYCEVFWNITIKPLLRTSFYSFVLTGATLSKTSIIFDWSLNKHYSHYQNFHNLHPLAKAFSKSSTAVESFFLSEIYFTDTDDSQDSWRREWTIFYSTLPLAPTHKHS